MIWNYFGHAGNESNDFCVPDGPFAYQMVENEKPHCLRRQWSVNRTMPPFGPPEWNTAIPQLSGDSFIALSILVISSHFKTHLSIGGYAGDMSIAVAPNEYNNYI
jgi:hypothetical protein